MQEKHTAIKRPDDGKSSRLFLFLTAVLFFTALIFAGFSAQHTHADQLTPSFSSTDGSACTDISDGNYFSTEYFEPGTEITLTTDREEGFDSLYIVWEYAPGEWTLRVDGKDYTYGTEGYLHEFAELPEQVKGADSVTLVVGDERITIADIYGFSAGPLPDFVQKWEPCYEQADVLLISTHADDEALFFGGIIPNYTDRDNVRVQVAYFTDLFQTELYRNHEILNGLWTMGVDHYPQLGEFYDFYSESFEEAQSQYDYDSSLEYTVRTIRRFKPQVLIGQDIINGEYGHGAHIWTARMIADAVEITADASSYPESAERYGVWDVPKTYLHLYPENRIELNARVPLDSLGGKTALETAALAYLEHQSQQWCWFYVSDGYDEAGNPNGYEYSCTVYGLYRTLVGNDTAGNDIMEHIVPYDDQERMAQEAALAKAREEESLAAEKAAAAGTETEETESLPAAQSVVDTNTLTGIPGGKNTTLLTICIILAAIVLAIIIGILVISRRNARIRAEKERLERRRELARNRARLEQQRNARSSASGKASQRYTYRGRK